MTGSWAGAMGHTQFIPTSHQAYAVDFDGDGRRDIWSDDPANALASTAVHLSQLGWRRGQPWGVEVRLPAGHDAEPVGRGGDVRAGGGWRDGAGLWCGAGSNPVGASGSAFMVFGNFVAISRYNNAVNYLIGVGHLSDRIAGGAPLRGSFRPTRRG